MSKKEEITDILKMTSLRQAKAIVLRVTPMSWSEVCRQLGVPRPTLEEWRQDEGFKAALAKAERESLKEDWEEIKQLQRRGSKQLLEKSSKAMKKAKLKTPHDVKEWFEAGVRTSRLIAGESTDNVAAKVQPVPATKEEIEEANRILGGND